MRYPEKQITLKNGADCLLCSPEPADAAEMLGLLRKTAEETRFMLRYADEIVMTAENEEAFLRARIEDPRQTLIIARVGGKIRASAGIACAAPYDKYRHRAELGITVEKACWSLGIGSALLSEAISCARSAGFERLELEVAVDNVRAASLYLKHGFVVYGKRDRAARYRDGSYGCEYLMALPL